MMVIVIYPIPLYSCITYAILYIVKKTYETELEMTIKFAKQNAAGRWHEINKEEVFRVLELAVSYQTETLAERFQDRQPEFSTVDEAYETLIKTGEIKFDDEWYMNIAAKDIDDSQVKDNKPQYQKTLDCGHTVYDPSHIMQTSYSGTACTDCYDYIESQGYAYSMNNR